MGIIDIAGRLRVLFTVPRQPSDEDSKYIIAVTLAIESLSQGLIAMRQVIPLAVRGADTEDISLRVTIGTIAFVDIQHMESPGVKEHTRHLMNPRSHMWLEVPKKMRLIDFDLMNAVLYAEAAREAILTWAETGGHHDGMILQADANLKAVDLLLMSILDDLPQN